MKKLDGFNLLEFFSAITLGHEEKKLSEYQKREYPKLLANSKIYGYKEIAGTIILYLGEKQYLQRRLQFRKGLCARVYELLPMGEEISEIVKYNRMCFEHILEYIER